jgi:prolyl-tRNA synthetase
MVGEVRRTLDLIAMDMLARSEAILKAGVRTITSLVEESPNGILRAGWCGSAACGHEMEDRLGVKTLGTPYEKEEFKGPCVVCGKPAQEAAYLARTY